MFFATPKERAYLKPFFVFYAFLILNALCGQVLDGMAGAWWIAEPRFWIFPLQTLVCGIVLARDWRFYDLEAPRRPAFATAVGVAVVVIWVAPQAFFHAAARWKGFDPTYFSRGSAAYGLTVALRFLRMVVAVPFVEEIFWRGFLLRFLVHEDFTKVPFGTFGWRSCGWVTLGFCLEHQPADWPAALLAGLLYNAVAYRTRSLSACILAHAVTNLLLGIFVMGTGQWGFW